jgi:predicted nucleic acid-binding protein
VSYLLDTNVVSEMRKMRGGKADPRVVAWLGGVDKSELFISVVTLAELEFGTRRMERQDAAQGALLRSWMEGFVLRVFARQILLVTEDIALRCGQLHFPNPRPWRDAFIAAAALVHKLPVVTRNVEDFERMDVTVINPWAG